MRHRLAVAALAAALACPQPATSAEQYPARPVRMVAPFPPGGGADITGRILADGLGPALGQTVVVDNRGGAASILGTDIVTKAAPDGYTLLLGPISLAFNAALYRKLPYDALRDLAPISLVADQPNILVAHPSVPAKSFKEFIALARAQPGKFTYGSAGSGTGTHLAMELLLMSQKVVMVHVPYKGAAPALTGVIGNEVSAFLSTFASALPLVKSERLRAFGVTSAQRAATLPDTPTIAEAGVPGYEYTTWYGFLAPAGTPRAIVEKLNRATVEVLGSPKVAERYVGQGLTPIPSTPARFADHLKRETEKWTKVVRDAKIPLQ
ncbi:MAG TPA: tripartite tricarboxylate transporter substrate binding protein [Burkholderiales bacterium]|nr:tripartite tricarboxylate transporter substrate binding protein [Burkholderiales bacterium]